MADPFHRRVPIASGGEVEITVDEGRIVVEANVKDVFGWDQALWALSPSEALAIGDALIMAANVRCGGEQPKESRDANQTPGQT